MQTKTRNATSIEIFKCLFIYAYRIVYYYSYFSFWPFIIKYSIFGICWSFLNRSFSLVAIDRSEFHLFNLYQQHVSSNRMPQNEFSLSSRPAAGDVVGSRARCSWRRFGGFAATWSTTEIHHVKLLPGPNINVWIKFYVPDVRKYV